MFARSLGVILRRMASISARLAASSGGTHVVEGPDRRDHAVERRVRRRVAQLCGDRARLRLAVGEQHRRRQVAAEQRVHLAAPVALARRPGVAPPQAREVVLELVAPEVADLPDRPQRQQRGARRRRRRGRAPTRAGDPPTSAPSGGGRSGARRPRSSQAISGGTSRNVAPQANSHPEAADDAELAEAAELHGDQRRVGDAGRERRRQRPLARAPQRDRQRVLDRLALRAAPRRSGPAG